MKTFTENLEDLLGERIEKIVLDIDILAIETETKLIVLQTRGWECDGIFPVKKFHVEHLGSSQDVKEMVKSLNQKGEVK